MKVLRKQTKTMFKKMDWAKDVKAGQKFEKASNKIVGDFLDKLIKQRSKTLSLNILDEIEQAIKNEYPTAYQKHKATEIKKKFQKLKTLLKSPKKKIGGAHHNKKPIKSTKKPKRKVKKVIKKAKK